MTTSPWLDRAAAARPDCAFVTPAYARARLELGAEPVLIGSVDGEMAVGFTWGRLFRRVLEIPSLPGGLSDAFWRELPAAARRLGAWTVRLNTFASPAQLAPPSLGPGQTRPRLEHIIPLDRPLKLSSNHKRSISTATKAGVTLGTRTDEAAAIEHVALQTASFARRAERGEAVSVHRDDRECRALMRAGAAVIYRAEQQERTLSSILILTSAAAGYYHSAGTSPEGMEQGASPWLIAQVSQQLVARGCSVFHLGGAAPDNPGLKRFKEGFGAEPVEGFAGSWNVAPKLLSFLAR